MVEKKEAPKKGEFIDLENTDFKKKKSFFKIFIKYLLLFLFFSLLVFVAFKNDFWGILEKKQETKILMEKNYFDEENNVKINNNKKEIDIIYNAIDSQKKINNKQEEINNKVELVDRELKYYSSLEKLFEFIKSFCRGYRIR